MANTEIVKGFYESVRRIFFTCRVAGCLPVIGLLSEKSKHSRCVWKSIYSIYYGISMISTIFFLYIHLYYISVAKGFIDLANFVLKALKSLIRKWFVTSMIILEGILFRCFSFASCLFLIRFSIRWKSIIKKIEDIERLLPPLKHPERVFKNINYSIYFMFTMAFVKYVMYIIKSIRMSKFASQNTGIEFSVKVYYSIYYNWIFDLISFNYPMVFFLQISKLQIAIIYIFIDCIVIIVSLYLIYHFQNFNQLMRTKQKRAFQRRNILWMDLQAHYTRLTLLVKVIDDQINPYVLLSFLSNLAFICKWVYDTLKLSHWLFAHPDWIVISDMVMEIVFKVSKLSAVSILSAHLHTLSREPLNLLHTLPDSSYTPEVQRFMDQVYNTKINLSGFGIFHVTRGTILLLFSTIITYELVLLQIHVIYKDDNP